MSPAEQVPAKIDATRPSTARLYDYYLGGTNNFEVDRQAADQVRGRCPSWPTRPGPTARSISRAAAWMAADQGIRQFIDIGSGLPTQNNTHEVVHPLVPRRPRGVRGRTTRWWPRTPTSCWRATAAPRWSRPTCATRTRAGHPALRG